MVDYTSVVSHTSTHFFKRKSNLIFLVAFSIVYAKIKLCRFSSCNIEKLITRS